MTQDDSIPMAPRTPPSMAGVATAAMAIDTTAPPPEAPLVSDYNPHMRNQFGAMNMGLPKKEVTYCPVCQNVLSPDTKEVAIGGAIYLACARCNPVQEAAKKHIEAVEQQKSQPQPEAQTEPIETKEKICPSPKNQKSTQPKPSKPVTRRRKPPTPRLRPT